MSVEDQIKQALAEIAASSNARATVEKDAFLIIHREASNTSVRLEGDDAAVALGSAAAVDAICEIIDIEDEDVLTLNGIHVQDAVFGLLETLFGEIDET